MINSHLGCHFLNLMLADFGRSQRIVGGDHELLSAYNTEGQGLL